MTQLPTPAFDGLYGDLILEHFRNPRNRKPVADAQVEVQELNPFCGDRVELQIKLDADGLVCEVSALAEGCSIIQASASMMSDFLRGKSLDEIEDLAERFRQMMLGNTGDSADSLGDLEAFEVVRQYPVRIKCALLPWTALEEGVQEYRSKAS
jgi:nitrogen fixation NifU-like protein